MSGGIFGGQYIASSSTKETDRPAFDYRRQVISLKRLLSTHRLPPTPEFGFLFTRGCFYSIPPLPFWVRVLFRAAIRSVLCIIPNDRSPSSPSSHTTATRLPSLGRFVQNLNIMIENLSSSPTISFHTLHQCGAFQCFNQIKMKLIILIVTVARLLI